MRIFWFIAAVQAFYVAFISFTGRIRLRGWAVIDRDIEPRRFHFFQFWLAVSVLILFPAAIFPSISA